MAKWKSKAQLEQEQIEDVKREMMAAVKADVAKLVADWEADGYPKTHAECEKAINVLIRATDVYKMWEGRILIQSPARQLAVSYFMQDIAKVLRRQQAEREKQGQEAFNAAAQGRATALKGYSDQQHKTSGDIVIVTIKGNNKRILTCISSEYVAPDEDENFDGGWLTNWAEPTKAEQATEAYKNAVEALESEMSWNSHVSTQAAYRREHGIEN